MSTVGPSSSFNVAFIALYTLLIESTVPARNEEYCVTLRHNAENPAIASIYLLTVLGIRDAHHLIQERCKLNPLLRRKIGITSGGRSLDNLTYGALLRHASAAVSPTRLQVVAHADIILGRWEPRVLTHSCLRTMAYYRVMFALSRREPTRCYPLLDGRERTRISSRAPNQDVYLDICMRNSQAEGSQDVLAFNVKIPEALLARLEFVPNQLGAENLLSCKLEKHGFSLWNVCEELPIFHNHCSDHRTYAKHRVDNSTPDCYGHTVPKRRLEDVFHLTQAKLATRLTKGVSGLEFAAQARVSMRSPSEMGRGARTASEKGRGKGGHEFVLP